VVPGKGYAFAVLAESDCNLDHWIAQVSGNRHDMSWLRVPLLRHHGEALRNSSKDLQWSINPPLILAGR
jgi:hypothetical protein